VTSTIVFIYYTSNRLLKKYIFFLLISLKISCIGHTRIQLFFVCPDLLGSTLFHCPAPRSGGWYTDPFKSSK